MNRTARRCVGAALLTVVTFAGSACGVSAGSGTDLAGLALPAGVTGRFASDAAAKTGEATSHRVSVEIEAVGADGQEYLSTRAEGAMDVKAGVGRMTTSVASDLAGLGSGDLDTEIVYDQDTVYVKAPILGDLLDKPWLRFRSEDMGSVASGLGDSGVTDPAGFLALLEGASGEMEDLGTEAVRDVPTRHVRTQVDVAALLGEVSDAQEAELRDQLRQFADAAEELGDIPVEAWIDADGYLRRMRVAVDLEAVGGRGAGGTVTQTVEFWGFGDPVEITVPPAAEVQELDPAALFGN